MTNHVYGEVKNLALSDVQIKQTKAKEKRYMLRDDRGLYIEVMPSGNKHWRLRYWENGKEHRIDLGQYPAVGLREARLKRDEINLNREKGVSPRKEKKTALTFEAVAREWHGRQVMPKTPRYAAKVFSILSRLVFPAIGERDIRDLSAPDLLAPLRAIEARGLGDTAKTARQICGQMFRYAVASGYVERNPAADLQGALAPVNVRHRASITDPRKLADLLRAMSAFEGSIVVRSALWFSAYTFLRPGEVRHLEWREVSLEGAEVRIPAGKMKMRRPHIVPLARQALKILGELKPLTGHGRYVFPSIRAARGDTPMSENTINAALRRLGFGRDEMTAHGFRSTASTLLNESGLFTPDIIERQLAHAEEDGVRAAYNYAEYLSQRREMMQWWADWLEGLG
ncbi:MAG: tyrosine-type recombinase/integrase [Synergistaceae bacterium]|jgi:integrase|nr:tyrosine-type recombinase/integrase [Synergistaceae bacterium]